MHTVMESTMERVHNVITTGMSTAITVIELGNSATTIKNATIKNYKELTLIPEVLIQISLEFGCHFPSLLQVNFCCSPLVHVILISAPSTVLA